MQTTRPVIANQVLDTYSPTPIGQFIYREAPWISMLMTIGLASLGGMMGYLSGTAAMSELIMQSTLFALCSILLIYGAIFTHSNESTKFICTHNGIYFPEIKRFSRPKTAFLLVPWHNILEYQVQRMFDETSSHGLVMTILVRPEDRAFLEHRGMFRLPAPSPAHQGEAILICFSSFSPRPIEVLAQLRKYDSVMRYQARSHQYHCSAPARRQI